MDLRLPARAAWRATFLGLLALCALRIGAAPAAPPRGPVRIDDSFEDFSRGRLDASGQNLYVSRAGSVRTIQRFDLDRDGFSDLVFCPSASGTQAFRRFLRIYWGDPSGWSARRSTGLLPVNDGVAVAIADLDGDRWPDIVQTVPTHGTHWMWSQDMGHIYDRKWRQVYESSAFHWEGAMRSGRLSFEAEIPGAARLVFRIRSSARPQQLERQPWRELRERAFVLSPADRYLEYQATFVSDNGDRYPVLDRVEIGLAP